MNEKKAKALRTDIGYKPTRDRRANYQIVHGTVRNRTLANPFFVPEVDRVAGVAYTETELTEHAATWQTCTLSLAIGPAGAVQSKFMYRNIKRGGIGW